LAALRKMSSSAAFGTAQDRRGLIPRTVVVYKQTKTLQQKYQFSGGTKFENLTLSFHPSTQGNKNKSQ